MEHLGLPRKRQGVAGAENQIVFIEHVVSSLLLLLLLFIRSWFLLLVALVLAFVLRITLRYTNIAM